MADTTTPLPLAPAPSRSPMVDRDTLLATRAWLTWFDLSYRRQGEAHAPSNAELDDGLTGTQDDLSGTQEQLSQTQEELSQTQEALAGTQTSLEATQAELDATQALLEATQGELTALTTRVETLETTVTALETTVSDQETRLAAVEAHLAAIIAAVPAAVSVATIPALANDPATSILLENDLTANWRPPVNANDTALATMANALRLALLETP